MPALNATTDSRYQTKNKYNRYLEMKTIYRRKKQDMNHLSESFL